MLLNTGSGGIDIFVVKLTFEMLTMREQQHSFSTHQRVFLGKSRPNELSGPDICCPMLLNTGSGGVDIFEVKLTFEILTAREQQY